MGHFVTGAALPDAAAVYCPPWSQAASWTLPLQGATDALALDPRTLLYTPQWVPTVGTVWMGTDTAARQERIAFYRAASGEVVAYDLAGAASGSSLYRALPDDPLPVGLPSTVRLVNVPGDIAAGSGVAPLETERIFLNVRAAVEVSYPAACSYTLYQDQDFTTAWALLPTEFDPMASAWPFVLWPSLEPGSEPAHVVPVEISNPSPSDHCPLITTRAVNDRIVTDLASGAATVPLFVAPTPSGQAYLAAERNEQPGRLELVPLSGTVPLGAFRITETMLALPRLADFNAAGDVLDLLQTRASGTLLRADGAPGERWLDVYPGGDASAGLGPFREAQPPPGDPAAVPFALAMAASAGAARQTVAIQFAAPARAAFWTDGGIRTQGRLLDSAGRLLAFSVAGATDGAGFRIEHDLAAGSYRLDVQAAPGGFTVHGEPLPSAPRADTALWNCLLESGAARGPAPFLRRAWCARRGIRRMDDLAPFTALEALDLSDNGIADLATLPAQLSALAVLSLAGNAIQDLAPLDGRGTLRQLSLARNPLAGGAVAVLVGMKDHLRLLDLTGVTTLTASEIDTLRTGLPNTFVVPPSGQP
jgi:hypothetical protein